MASSLQYNTLTTSFTINLQTINQFIYRDNTSNKLMHATTYNLSTSQFLLKADFISRLTPTWPGCEPVV